MCGKLFATSQSSDDKFQFGSGNIFPTFEYVNISVYFNITNGKSVSIKSIGVHFRSSLNNHYSVELTIFGRKFLLLMHCL